MKPILFLLTMLCCTTWGCSSYQSAADAAAMLDNARKAEKAAAEIQEKLTAEQHSLNRILNED